MVIKKNSERERERMSEVRSQMSEVRCQKSDVRSQMSEVRCQKSDIRKKEPFVKIIISNRMYYTFVAIGIMVFLGMGIYAVAGVSHSGDEIIVTNTLCNAIMGHNCGSDNTGLATESDPTVPAAIKDGIAWAEISGRPTGLDDGDNYAPNTDTQDLSISGNTISLTRGGKVTVPDKYAPDTVRTGRFFSTTWNEVRANAEVALGTSSGAVETLSYYACKNKGYGAGIMINHASSASGSNLFRYYCW